MSIYLDSAATTRPKKEVIDAIIPYLTNRWCNPSSLYQASVKVKKEVENARKVIADFINANSSEIYFTSSGSESNSWVIQGFVNQCKSNNEDYAIITSTIEHKSILACMEEMDYKRGYIHVDNKGFLMIDMLESFLKMYSSENKKTLVSIQFANNEIGTIQHIKEIAKLVHKYNAIFHTDAVQAFGQVNIDVVDLGIDVLSASGHKIGCPKGIGVLYKNKNVNIKPLIYGTQMNSMRGGTENVPYIMGMAKAVQICKENLGIKNKHILDLRNYMISELIKRFNCKLNGDDEYRLSNNINVTFPQNVTGESLIYMLDTSDIQISSGSACNSRLNVPSFVLRAIGLSDEEIMRTVRISLSDEITKEQIDYVINEIEKSIKILEV